MASNTKNRRAAQRRNASTFGRNSGRKPKQPTGLAKALGMLPMSKKATPTKSSRGGGKTGTAAMLTAAAGFAYKNRAKIGGLLGKRRQPN